MILLIRASARFVRASTSAAQLLFRCRLEENLSYLAMPPRGGHAFAPPFDRLIHVGAFQYPKTADVLLGLKVGTVGDEDASIALRPKRLRGA